VKRTVYTKVDDFLLDDDFIRYAMDACPDRESYWTSYLTAAPQIRRAYLKAYDILTHLHDCETLSPSEVKQLKSRVMHTIRMSFN
jgi:hypothetical protein